MTSDLETIFGEYDGKSVEPFRRAAEGLPPTTGSLHDLVTCARGGGLANEVGATWVLKHLLECDVEPDGVLGQELCSLLDTLRHHDALLHVLQCLPLVPLEWGAKTAGARFKTWLGLTRSEHAFVRAWAYNALGLLAGGSPRHRARVEALFADATRHETAAVKARIRHASKALSKRSG